jgi:hypothetical protein
VGDAFSFFFSNSNHLNEDLTKNKSFLQHPDQKAEQTSNAVRLMMFQTQGIMESVIIG